MNVHLQNLTGDVVGEVTLDQSVFGVNPRQDIVKMVIDWQLLKAMSGNHQTKTISEVSGTTKKPFKQKGTGNARQGSLRSVHMRGGGISFGPVVRSHAIGVNKKVRKLALRCALSDKYLSGKLLVVDSFDLDSPKTSNFIKILKSLGIEKNVLMIDDIVGNAMKLAVRNVHTAMVLPQIGANVYDIVKSDTLILSRTAVQKLQERLL